MSNEKSIIEFEAARNKAMDLWFDARKHIELNITSQFIFEASFRMAWELNQTKITELEQQLAQEREATKELISAIRSINKSRHHNIKKDGDEFFIQRVEWVEWILEMAKETETATNPPSEAV